MIRILETLLVPKDRIRVVKDRETKERIEKELGVKMSFSDNLVEIDGEGVELFRAKDIVKAIHINYARRPRHLIMPASR